MIDGEIEGWLKFVYAQDEPTRDLDLLMDLHRGLKNGEFTVYYQPIVTMDLKQIVGVEALVRWQHPHYGLVLPTDFIPVAEGSYIIYDLGKFVLSKACQDIQRWHLAGRFIDLHVNVSLRQFTDDKFSEIVQKVLQDTKFDPQYLHLELTESVAILDLGKVLGTMDKLVCLGVRFSQDDFGMEYSTFQWLKDIPQFSSIKLDISYVQDVHVDSRRSTIVKSILSLAENLNLHVIAEGIESTEDKDFLQQNGCRAFQGFLYSPPVPIDEFNKLIPWVRGVANTSLGTMETRPIQNLIEPVEQLSDYQWLEKWTVPVLNAKDVVELMGHVKTHFEERFDFDRFGIMLGTMNDKYCVVHEIVTRKDMEACPTGTLMAVKGTGLEHVYQTQDLHYNPDMRKYPEFLEDNELAGIGLRSMVRIPLIARGSVIGVMTVKSTTQRLYSERDLELMRSVADRISPSLYSLKLIYSLRETSYKDGLTGAFNRRFLNDISAADGDEVLKDLTGIEVSENYSVALLFVDIDKFKDYNDQNGHSAGDSLLVSISHLLAETGEEVAQASSAVIRYGGDEFVVLLIGLDNKRVLDATNRFQANIPNKLTTALAGLTLSFGVAYGKWGELEDLVDEADKEMYKAKSGASRPRRVLFTGFQPFDGDAVNPALEAVRLLNGRKWDDVEFSGIEVPTVFGKAIDAVREGIAEHQPNVVICVGQAGGRAQITPERIAINVDDARIPDNEGNQPVDAPVVEGGPAAYWSTLPVKAMVQEMKEAGIPAAVSNTAGTYVCNHIFYGLMHELVYNHSDIRGGFIHIPFLPEQVTERNAPSMSLELIVRGLELCGLTSARQKQDIPLTAGTES